MGNQISICQMTENNLKTMVDYHLYHGMHQDHNNFIASLGRIPANQETFNVIYDIGSATLHWWKEAITAFPNSDIYCFDAGNRYEPLYDYIGIPKSHYHLQVLGCTNSKINVQARYDQGLETVNVYPENLSISGISGDIFVEEERAVATLDSIIEAKKLPLPDLIKMDIQGSELDVLLGGSIAVNNAKAIILELPHVEYNLGAADKDTIIAHMDSLGFYSVGCFSNNGPDGDYYFTRHHSKNNP